MRRRLSARIALAVTMVGSAVVISGAAGAAPTAIDFESLPPGTLLSTQLSGQGVTFPQGLEVYQCTASTCISARSGSQVVRGQFSGEFQRDPFEAVFTNLQKTASLWVRSDAQFSPAKNIIVTMNAYNASGNPIGTQTKNFSSGAGWQQLTVGSLAGSANIKRVVVSGGQDDFPPTNFLSYDDLSFDAGDATEPSPSPSPQDTTPPNVIIFEPPGATTITEQRFDLELSVDDASGIFSVTGDVSGSEGIVTPIDLCGSTFSGICPASPATFSQSVSLPGAPNGLYVLTIVACDPFSNCRSRVRNITLDVTEVAPREVVISRVEVNQGVQTRLSEVPRPGIAANVNSGVQLIPGKDMSVRWFLFGDGGIIDDFEARLLVTIFKRNGSIVTRSSRPNAQAFPPDLAPEPASTDLLRTLESMRADRSATLNFVVPGSLLQNAQTVQLQLKRRSRILTGFLQGRFVRPLRVGLNVIRVGGSAVDTGPPSSEVVDTNIVEYLKRAYPVSEVRVLSTRMMLTSTDLIGPAFGCNYVLWQLWSEYGGDETPVRSFTSDRNIITTLGVVGNDAIDDSLGCAYVGDADDIDDRRGGSVITEAWGDTAAQEIGHQMGLIHASNSHNEEDGGDAETGWPHVHGTIGDRAYGAVIEMTVAPEGGDLGFATVRTVDPCPTSDPAERYPTCLLDPDDAARPHDFMSYGPSSTDLSPLVTAKNRWISQTTYTRLFAAIGLNSSPVYPRAATPEAVLVEDRTDAIMVATLLDENGDATLLPLLSKPLPAFMLGGDPGDFNVSLLGEGGEVLAEGSFEETTITTHDRRSSMIRAVFPFVPGIETVRVEDETTEEVLVEEEASATAPVVEITQPTGGEIFPDGMLEVTWEASDADGDPLYHLVQFSPDGGSSWQGLQMVPPGNPTTASVDVSELIEGNHGLIRVLTSDGINMGQDATDVFFSVGTSDPPATDNKVDRRISLNIKAGKRKAIGKLRAPDGPFSCIEDMRVLLKRNGKTIKRKDTNLFGKVTFRLPKRNGRYRLVAKKRPAALLVCRRARSPVKRFKL